MAREMKDSGVEWIREIPCTWSLSKIGRVYTERKTKVSDRDYPPLSVTMRGILPQLDVAAKTDAHDDRKLLCKGDFAINSRSDRRGSCGISPIEGSVSLINIVLQPKEDMDSQYYEWMFHSSMFSDEFYKWGHGIVDDLWTTGWQDMKRIAIPTPALQEQKRIAMFLNEQCGELDNVLAKTRASIEEYKKLKQAVITQAVTKGIRGDTEIKDSGIDWIGEIPVRWRITSLKYLCKMQAGKTLSSERIEKSGEYPVYGANGIRGFYKEFNADGTYLLIGRQGALCGNVHKAEGKFWATEHAVLVNVLDSCNLNFLYYMLIGMNLNQYASNTAAQPGLAVSTILNVKMCIPPIDEQERISVYLDEKCEVIDSLVAKKEQYHSEIENYKKSLIYEYVTGKKEVPQKYQASNE